jgi:tetratricopeptide (TPR) repeat protein
MKNVDRIIGYLSNEMSGAEKEAFERALESNELLKKEYEEIEFAYRLVDRQLWKQDEERFKNRLLEVMNKKAFTRSSNRRLRKGMWYFLIPIAASLTLLVLVFTQNPSTEKIYSRFFDPGGDPVLEILSQQTRGGTDTALRLYSEGAYDESFKQLSQMFEEDPEAQEVRLYLLLNSMELDREQNIVEKVMQQPATTDHQVGQAITWYSSLALIKSGQPEEAAKILEPLTLHPGPYEKVAKKLKKILLK